AGSVRPADGSDRTPLRALGLIVVALAALLAVGLLGWRSGAVDRLSQLLYPSRSEPATRNPDGGELEPLAHLTVIRAPSEHVGPRHDRVR
ncbi:MAG TPA: hypothetical protein VFM74_08320, partial [Candidatus Limnocylindria bacterium]|nr:hypothetical protein [Candidatus Limnocylindria bacterium]